MTVILLVVSAILAAVFLTAILLQREKIRKLTESIDAFLLDGTQTELSTEDSAFGHLQNDICQLENRLLQERNFTLQEAKSNTEFLSDISHQLKTPLAGLRLYCEMEHASTPSSHTEKELVLIEKMEHLIQNVLTLEKIRSKSYVMNFKTCDLSKIAGAIRSELQPLFPEKQILVEGQASIRADENWFHEALGNLVKNGCEHTKPDGMVKIQITPGETSVCVTVEDDGGGVAVEDLPKLFHRFHRAANATPNSAGIGLAITKAVIEKHHGIISARNGAKGLSVVICIPIIDANLKIQQSL